MRRATRSSEFSAWLPDALVRHVEAGHAVLSIYANDPDQLKDAPADLVSVLQQATAHSGPAVPRAHLAQPDELGGRRGRGRSWAARVFPDVAAAEQVPRLWDAIARLCRLDRPDPIAAWEPHLPELAARTRF